jgi:hypothetical protein
MESIELTRTLEPTAILVEEATDQHQDASFKGRKALNGTTSELRRTFSTVFDI